ncbi:MAG: ribosome silencing factor [Burkholderiales bacterium]|nr:ribosome silencing factor [Burkholderiales bacterium]
MDIRKLQRAIVDGLEDVKAQNVVVYNTEALSPLFERVIIASGTSNRQTKALASSVRETVKKRGLPVLRTEGEANGEWIIVDCGAAVAHIMQPAIRDYYHLEEIWGAKPVRLKGAGDGHAERLLPKASEPQATMSSRPTSARPAAPRPPAEGTAKGAAKGAAKGVERAGTRGAAKSAAKPKAKASARPAAKVSAKPSAKPSAKSSAKPAAGKPAAKRPAAKRLAPKGPAAKKTAARKPAAKTAARKPAAKRPAASGRPAPRKAGASGSRPR